MGGKVVTELVAGIPLYPSPPTEAGNHLVGIAVVPLSRLALGGEQHLLIGVSAAELSEEISHLGCYRDSTPLPALAKDGYLACLEVNSPPSEGDHFSEPYASVDE